MVNNFSKDLPSDSNLPSRLAVRLGEICLQNPIIPASGTFGFGYEYEDWFPLNILGAISLKGTTRNPRFGNPTPRIAECSSGMLNAVGLQNPGVDAVIQEEIPKLRKVYAQPIIANISGFTIEEYVETAQRFDACSEVQILEINISCPNVHGGGMSFGVDPASAAAVTEAVRKAVQKPVFMKLSPNVTDIAAIAKACEDAGADGISLINTLTGMRISLASRRPILKNRTGGMSGPAIFPLALRMVWDVYEAVNIPIIGMGGISSAEDVLEMLMAGASAVQIGAANLITPNACEQILNELPSIMDTYHITSLRSIIGTAHTKS